MYIPPRAELILYISEAQFGGKIGNQKVTTGNELLDIKYKINKIILREMYVYMYKRTT